MKRILIVGLFALVLAGCATAPPQEPRGLTFPTPAEETLRQAVGLLVEQGYIIRHADLALGRAEGALARWPEYRVQLHVVAEGEQASRLLISAQRGGQPLPPHLLDPWLVALQVRMGVAP
ncbi:hypothetical protein R5M92_12610 [Halomonas sp. Bachu 37]|uniref:hypothetical protein n=1 Tax=Halomonas kashgarensis TaxID=3084920 RepID=UPI003216244A